MRDLAERMHAGIGAAGALNPHLLAANALIAVIDRALHGRRVVLDLPAGKRRAVIFDDEFVAGHQPSRAGGLSGVPRKKSAAFIGALPARCNSRIRIAPSPQAMVRRSSSTSPGAPRTLRRFAAEQLDAGGLGVGRQFAPCAGKRRQPVNMAQHSRAGRVQSIRASALSILAA